MVEQRDLTVETLGACSFPSPFLDDEPSVGQKSLFMSDTLRVRPNVEVDPAATDEEDLLFEAAGPRERIFFDPARTTAALVTCGGLSPGLNNVLRSAWSELTVNYGVRRVLGIRNGYLGLTESSGLEPVTLNRQFIGHVDEIGGTVLGSSRGPQDAAAMVDFLVDKQIDILFCIGGDGTQRAALGLQEEIRQRGLSIAIVGIPKTIDNDIPFVRVSFGFATALDKAAEVIKAAHIEACGAINGIGLVKVMGRHAGFIAAGATVASQEVNFTLVPEVSFPLDGERGLLVALEKRLEKRDHAVVVVAEGAGQHLVDRADEKRDASGNLLSEDIGVFLKQKITDHFAARGVPISLKYLDPSYLIRSVPANVYDRVLSDRMARFAVHAGMAGKTGMLVGFDRDRFLHVPIRAAVSEKKNLDVRGDLWRAVLQVTGQPKW